MEKFWAKWKNAANLYTQENSGKQEYYRLSDRLPPGRTVLACMEAAVLCIMLSMIFYQSLWPGAVCLPVFSHFYRKRRQKQYFEKKLRRFRADFVDMAQMLSSNLLAGYSLENAMEKTCRQLKESNKDMGDLYTMLVRMLRQISMGESTEDVWLDFSRQIPIEEIQVFGQIFGLSKRSGASLPDVLQKVVRQLCLKIQTEAQIQTVIAGKRAEQKVMNFMPSGILVYISITSSDMMKVMYESLIGRLIMTICLGVYILAYCLSEKMLRNYL